MRRFLRRDISEARFESLRLVGQVRPHRIDGFPIGSERLAAPLEFGVRLPELQPLRGESRFPPFEVRECGCVCFLTPFQVSGPGPEFRGRGLVGIHGCAQFLFLTADFMAAVLERFLSPGDLTFISLQGCASLIQRLVRSRQERLGFGDFSLHFRQIGLADLRGLFLPLDRLDVGGDFRSRGFEGLSLRLDFLSSLLDLRVRLFQFGPFFGCSGVALLELRTRRRDRLVLLFDICDARFEFRLGRLEPRFARAEFFLSLLEGFRLRRQLALPFRQFIGLPSEGGPFRFRCLLARRQRTLRLGEVPLCLRHGSLAGLQEAILPLRGFRLRCNSASSRLELPCAVRNLGFSLRQGRFSRVQLFRRELHLLLEAFEFRAPVREFLPSLRELASVSLERRTLCDQLLFRIRESRAAFLEFLQGRREGCLASFDRPFCLATVSRWTTVSPRDFRSEAAAPVSSAAFCSCRSRRSSSARSPASSSFVSAWLRSWAASPFD